jgi:hypothetical protein
VRERPLSDEDCQFWQYPCSTEKQAYDNHAGFVAGSNIDNVGRIVNTYLGLPWATYIDKKHFPADVLTQLKPRLRGMACLAEHLGYRLAVHTVCQQIYWRRLMEQYHALQVTDLHISHAEVGIDPRAEGWTLRIHSWPLIAPNVEDKSRSMGLVFGKPIGDRRYFASFIGAHMPHYRSDVRVRLLDAARVSGRDDVLVDLGKEWHFNKVVYMEQVLNKALTADDHSTHIQATLRYNGILGDTVFSLCPEGAGPNTLRVWESLAVGAIPVILADKWMPPQLGLGGADLRSCCIFYPSGEIDRLFNFLSGISKLNIERMHRECIAAYGALRTRASYSVDANLIKTAAVA